MTQRFAQSFVHTYIRPVVIWTGVALLIATLVSYFQGHHSYFFELTLVSSRAETARLHTTSNRGASVSSPFRHRAGSSLFRFPLATGNYQSLYFAPISDTGSAELSDIKIIDRNGRLIRSFDPTNLRPIQQIQNYSVKNGTAKMDSIQGAISPRIEITSEPFVLPKLGFDFLYNCVEALPVFFIVLLGGACPAVCRFRIAHPRQSIQPKTDQPGSVSPIIRALKWMQLRQRMLILALATVILFLRMPDRFFTPQFWAEDAYFFTDALQYGVKSLFQPYGGYLLLTPRLVELAATFVPLVHVPLFLNLAALSITLGVISRVFSQRSRLVQPALLALAVVTLPHMEDILLSIENTQWIMALGFLLLLVSEEATTTAQKIYDYATAFLCSLTGVFCIIFFPLFVIRLWSRRTQHTAALLIVIGAAALVQGWFVIHTPPIYENPAIHFDYLGVPITIGYQVLVRLLGAEWMPYLAPPALMGAGITIAIYWAFLFVWQNNASKNSSSHRYLAVAMAIAIAASIYRFKYVLFIFATPEHIARYFFLPNIIFIWLVIGELRENMARRTVAAILLCAFAVSSITYFGVDPLWDFQWKAQAEKISAGKTSAVPINPPGWFFQYPGEK